MITTIIFYVPAFAKTGENSSETKNNMDATGSLENAESSNERLNKNYTIVSGGYTLRPYEGEDIEYSVEKAYISTSGGILTTDNYNYKNRVLDLKIGDNTTLVLDVPKEGIYYLRLDYLSYSDSSLPAECSVTLNGEIPFYEARRLLFENNWSSSGEKIYDRYGNEIVPIPDKVLNWESKYLVDASYRNSKPLALELNQGKNEIGLSVTEGSLLLGNLYLTKEIITPQYEKAEIDGEGLVIIEGENVDLRNDSSIRATCEFDTALTPYETKNKVLNVLDGASFKDAGQRITYNFTTPKSGYYNLGFAYKQSSKSDFPVFADISIDGEIPNTLLQAYAFPYEKDYSNIRLKDKSGKNIGIYLEEGTHTISLTLNIDNIRHVLESVDKVMNDVNDLALEITKVAGTNKDKYRDLDIVAYIPDIKERLITWAEELEALQTSVKQYNPSVKKIATFSSLSVASSRLRSLAKDPKNIPYRINELAQSTNSVMQYLANLIDILNKNALSLDKVYIIGKDEKLPKGSGIFKSMYLNTVRFFSSFGSQDYSASNKQKDHLQVWVNRSRQYVEILQRMIDESFTPLTGIKVDVSIMPDQNKLIMANASGDAPDVAASINYAIPFELGIRGAIKDLTEFEDYRDVLTRTVDGLHIPATIGDGIYAMPETINFWVLYYRKDILEKLGLEVPNTMEDVKEMLPELQMRGLNFYYPTAGMIALKTFHGTTPLLYQYGATLYGETAGNTAINSDAAIKGLTELTELFTIYNLPVDVPSFYQHFRNGDMPIGVAEYNMYNLLINAAPEISNSWGIALIPGMRQENGEVLRYASGGAESCVIFNSDAEREQKAWEYLKWWTSTETQVEFGQTLQVSYGDEYIWNTANVDAFGELPWKTKDKDVIMEQTQWMLESPRILGTYMLERELSNSYNKVVVNGKDLRLTIDSSVKRINRETERKLIEFGFLSEKGEVLKEYIVPTIEHVREILYGEE
jgi:ABC-type glycerol-3-phosphate transport system substrate-binding protein